MTKFTLTVTCKSTRGIVAALSGYLAAQGCNIIDSSQFDDLDTGRFFMRVSFLSEQGKGMRELAEGLAPVSTAFGMDARLHDGDGRMKVLLMVSRFGHASTICSTAGRSVRCRSISSVSSRTISITRRSS